MDDIYAGVLGIPAVYTMKLPHIILQNYCKYGIALP